MAIRTNNAEGGTAGVAPTTTDTGSGDPWDVINAGAVDSIFEYTNVATMRGNLAYRMATRTTGAATTLIWDVGPTSTIATLLAYHRFYFMISAAPTSDTVLAITADHNGANGAGQLLLTSAGGGVLRIRNSGGGTTYYSFTNVPTPGTWYRCEIYNEINGVNARCKWQVKLFVGDSLTPLEDSGVWDVAGGGTLTNINRINFGHTGTGATNVPTATGFQYYDEFASFARTWIGPTTQQRAFPVSDVSSGTWRASSGGALYAPVSETDPVDTDYTQASPSPYVADEEKVRLGPLTDPAVSTDHVISYRFQKDQDGGDRQDMTVTLYAADGVTVIASWTHNDIPNGWTEAEQILTGTQTDAIPSADYATGLVLGFRAIRV